eukprot:10520080-Lingulodinium_polyedra.AAC.1
MRHQSPHVLVLAGMPRSLVKEYKERGKTAPSRDSELFRRRCVHFHSRGSRARAPRAPARCFRQARGA